MTMTRRILRMFRFSILLFIIFLFIMASPLTTLAQGAKVGVARPLADVKFEGDDTKCLRSATETGDPDTGPSTLILKASPGCKVRWHDHTAEEQLIVTQGNVETEMTGMSPKTLTPGGFAMMPGKMKHRFSCVSTTECIMFVSFDRKYDIVWYDRPDAPAK